MNTIIVIPAYNEVSRLAKVIKDIRTAGFHQVLVVDDGSEDGTAEVATAQATWTISHPLNRGVGAATATGVKAALQLGAEAIVTIDADGQHDPNDINKLVAPIKSGQAEVVIGSRFLNKQDIPLTRRAFNRLGNFFTLILAGMSTTDSQSGLKAFSRQAAQQIQITADGYEFCSELFREIRSHRLIHQEVPISVSYHPELRKGQHFGHGIEVLAKLIIRSLLK